MASPITIHATHPTAHFYRESTTYSQPNHVRQLREGVVDPQRPHLYQQDRCQSPLRRGVHYRSTRLGGSLGPAQKDRPPSLGHNTLPGDRPMAPHFNLPASYSMSSPGSNADSNRVPIDRLTDRYPGPPTSATPTFRRPSEQTETTRLPGIGSVSAAAVVATGVPPNTLFSYSVTHQRALDMKTVSDTRVLHMYQHLFSLDIQGTLQGLAWALPSQSPSHRIRTTDIREVL